jgi:hypothetical protein
MNGFEIKNIELEEDLITVVAGLEDDIDLDKSYFGPKIADFLEGETGLLKAYHMIYEDSNEDFEFMFSLQGHRVKTFYEKNENIIVECDTDGIKNRVNLLFKGFFNALWSSAMYEPPEDEEDEEIQT